MAHRKAPDDGPYNSVALAAPGVDPQHIRAAGPGLEKAIAAGAIGYGAGGPVWLDQFRSKRAPQPTELVEQFKAVAFSCMGLNGQGVVDTPLRLYCRTGPRDAAPRRTVVEVPSHRLEYLRRHRSINTIMNGASNVHEIVEHPFLEALDTPNPHFDGSLFLLYLAYCLDCIGSFYFFPVRPDPTWAAKELWPLQPQYVLPVKGAGSTILQKYTYFGESFGPDELERGRFLSMRDPYLSGYAPLHACYEQLGLINYYNAVIESTLRGGARPSMMVGPKDPAMPWGKETQARITTDINNQFGNGRQGFIWVVDGTFDAKTLSYPPTDLGGLELTKNGRLIVANCFGVPISLLQTEDSNRAVAEAGERQHQKNAIRPRCTAIASAFTKMLRAIDPRLFCCFDNPVQADREQVAKVFALEQANGATTPNEYRAEQGKPPVEWGNEPWMPGTLAQPTMLAKRDERAATSADVANKATEAQAAAASDTEPGSADPDEAAAKKKAKAKRDRQLLARANRLLARLEQRESLHPGRPDRGDRGDLRCPPPGRPPAP